MELHFKPTHDYYKNLISGAVGQCCKEIIRLFEENRIRMVDFASRGVKLIMVFSDGVGGYWEERIQFVYRDMFGDYVIVGENESSESFNDRGGNDYGIIEPVIGEIYSVIATACSQGLWLEGEKESDVLD